MGDRGGYRAESSTGIPLTVAVWGTSRAAGGGISGLKRLKRFGHITQHPKSPLQFARELRNMSILVGGGEC
jgi:hypothetical protein